MIDPWTIAMGVGAGITFSLSAYFKKEKQDFDWLKFSTTVAIGGLAGVGMSLFNLPVAASYEYVLALGAIPIVENVMKMIWRNVPKLWKKEDTY